MESEMHNLTMRNDGFVEMAYRKGSETPWHHLGNQVPANASSSLWQKLSGMDFTIKAAIPQFSPDDDSDTISVTDRKVLYRSDNHQPLAVVSDRYQIVQPSEIHDFFRDVVQTIGLTMETAGTLFGGKKLWGLAKIGEDALLDHDKIKGYLLLTTTIDGSMATTGKFTGVRVVCDNTLGMALNGYATGASIKVPHSTKFDAKAVQEALGVAPKTFTEFKKTIELLAHTPVSKRKAAEATKKIFDEGWLAVNVNRLFAGDAIGYEAKGFAGTAWGWLQSCTEVVDHGREKASPSHQIAHIMYGRGDKQKRQAFDLAMEMAR
jgi:phage/plasmid-like protein (TIGR03299 family)